METTEENGNELESDTIEVQNPEEEGNCYSLSKPVTDNNTGLDNK